MRLGSVFMVVEGNRDMGLLVAVIMINWIGSIQDGITSVSSLGFQKKNFRKGDTHRGGPSRESHQECALQMKTYLCSSSRLGTNDGERYPFLGHGASEDREVQAERDRIGSPILEIFFTSTWCALSAAMEYDTWNLRVRIKFNLIYELRIRLGSLIRCWKTDVHIFESSTRCQDLG